MSSLRDDRLFSVSYTCCQLLSLGMVVTYGPDSEVCLRIDQLMHPVNPRRRRMRRGTRAGCCQQLKKARAACTSRLIPVAASVSRVADTRLRSASNNCRVRIRPIRHSRPPIRRLTFGVMNVHSANDKIDNILAFRREHRLDILLLCESWHDKDSVSIRRLRSDGMRVIEEARPRVVHNMSTNHGGVVMAVTNAARLQSINTGGRRSTFEHICGRITAVDASCVVLLIYRPGSAAVTDLFFVELADVLHRLVVLNVPLIVAGDANVHLEQSDDLNSRRFRELLASFGLESRVSTSTHDRGGWLDVVATRVDLPAPVVEVIDTGFSDHRLLHWTSTFERPTPIYKTTTSRPWRSIDVDHFSQLLRQSLISTPHSL